MHELRTHDRKTTASVRTDRISRARENEGSGNTACNGESIGFIMGVKTVQRPQPRLCGSFDGVIINGTI